MWELDYKVWVLKNWCFETVVLEKTLESPLDCKEIKPVNHKGNQPWICTGRTDAEAPILWPPDAKRKIIGKRPWCWERLRARGEAGNIGWDGWMTSLIQWTWVCANSRRQWRTGKPGVLPSMGSQRVRHHWATEQKLKITSFDWLMFTYSTSKITNKIHSTSGTSLMVQWLRLHAPSAGPRVWFLVCELDTTCHN